MSYKGKFHKNHTFPPFFLASYVENIVNQPSAKCWQEVSFAYIFMK